MGLKQLTGKQSMSLYSEGLFYGNIFSSVIWAASFSGEFVFGMAYYISEFSGISVNKSLVRSRIQQVFCSWETYHCLKICLNYIVCLNCNKGVKLQIDLVITVVVDIKVSNENK